MVVKFMRIMLFRVVRGGEVMLIFQSSRVSNRNSVTNWREAEIDIDGLLFVVAK